MRILAIESSCDETAAAIVENGMRVRSNIIASSRDAFERTGGVIPEDAARRQVECVLPVVHQALEGIVAFTDEIDAIAVTKGPGLLGSLLVGTVTARTLSRLWKKPLIGVHHTLGHLSSTWLGADENEPPQFPVLTLSASGGHTDVWLRSSHTRGKLIGRTRDDAAGEAFDKGASILGLPYPGGPAISLTGKDGDDSRFPFPMPLQKDSTLDFSFSGLKTSLKYTVRDCDIDPLPLADLAASYEKAICAHLCDVIKRAIALHPEIREVHVVGGVSANNRLRVMVKEAARDCIVRFPMSISYCTDNAAMIAAAAQFIADERGEHAFADFEAAASLPLDSAIIAD
jgi:N6-L-threonylcarbamoyladenine synthase